MFEYVAGAAAPDEDPAGTRMSAARTALARAEVAAGLRTRLTGPGLAGPGLAADGIELPAGLDALFPGGLAAGTAVSVRGSAALVHTLAAAAMGERGWAAVVGTRNAGWVAAAEAGMDLSRVVVIPAPGPAVADVVAACVDGFGVVVTGDLELGAGARRSLSGRIRSNGTVLLTTGEWPGAPVLRARVRGGAIGLGGLADRVISVRREGLPTTVVVRMGAVARAAQEQDLAVPELAVPELAVPVHAVRERAGRRHLRAVS